MSLYPRKMLPPDELRRKLAGLIASRTEVDVYYLDKGSWEPKQTFGVPEKISTGRPEWVFFSQGVNAFAVDLAQLVDVEGKLV